jgi:lipopolysaccharide transport system ATP-binding protein
MSNTVISVENLSKSYRLGQIGTGTLANDLKVWWAKVRGKPNPLLKIGQVDQGNLDGEILWALKNINLTIEQGEALGIIGRNGAGKSTLLKILSRVTAPTCGEVKIRGRISSLLEVGTGFHPELTGRENIYLNGAILGMNKVEVSRKFDEIVNFAEIEQFIDTPVKRYSSGMYVRLAFAVAAYLESEILVVDEVLAVGDHEFQKKSLGKMGNIGQEGRTVLFVSHNLQSIRRLCPRVIWLNAGEFMESGPSDNVIEHYLMSGNSQDMQTEITPAMHKNHSAGLEVFSIEIMNRNQLPTRTLIINEPYTIRLKYRVHEPRKKYRISINFRTMDGTIIATISTADDGGAYIQGEKDLVYILTASLQNILMSGQYNLDVWIKAYPNEFIDSIDPIGFFVENIHAGEQEQRVSAIVNINASWTKEVLSPAY